MKYLTDKFSGRVARARSSSTGSLAKKKKNANPRFYFKSARIFVPETGSLPREGKAGVRVARNSVPNAEEARYANERLYDGFYRRICEVDRRLYASVERAARTKFARS